jgi:hypothetical protein
MAKWIAPSWMEQEAEHRRRRVGRFESNWPGLRDVEAASLIFPKEIPMQRMLLALALIVTATASYGQSMQGHDPRDPYGRPLIGRDNWVRQPGDGPGNAAGNPNTAQMPAPAARPMYRDPQTGPHQTAFKDEYGFRYDAEGNRLGARGNIISPHTR